jgi:Mrp family chromosome partitioning ATPase
MRADSGNPSGRVDQPARWIARRARLALRRPMRMLVAGAFAFVGAVALIMFIQQHGRAPVEAGSGNAVAAADTLRLAEVLRASRRSMADAEAELAALRATATRPLPPPPPADTLPDSLRIRRDSLSAFDGELTRALARIETSPLPASYRALGEIPAMSAQPRVRTLLDSLAEIERERDALGAIGGVDPVFVALTTRGTAIGRGIQALADSVRSAVRAEIRALTPAPPPRPPPRVVIDTAPLTAVRDAAVATLDSANTALVRMRLQLAEQHQREEALRALDATAASPQAIAGAALVLALALGFALSLGVEAGRPRVADAAEAELATGLRVLATIRLQAPDPERVRRRADREAPAHIDTASDIYRLLYLHLTSQEPRLALVTITGDDRTVAAAVAANLAVAAASDARNTLLVDADPEMGTTTALVRARHSPGVADIVDGSADWAVATVPAIIGRSISLDVVPGGTRKELGVGPNAEDARHGLARLARRYDLTVVVSPLSHVCRGSRSILPEPDMVYCVRRRHTSVRELQSAVQSLKGAGARIRGLVLWDAPLPEASLSRIRRPE